MNQLNSLPLNRVTVLGTLNIDLVWRVPRIPRPGETIIADSVRRAFGGKGANQAVAAARQGSAVRMVGMVGADADGESYRERLRGEGVHVQWLLSTDRPTGSAHVYVDGKGENLIVVDRGANGELTSEKVAGALASALPTTEVLLLQLEGQLEAAVEALRQAAKAAVRAVLNASPVTLDFPWGAVSIDTVVVNEHECCTSFEMSAEEFRRLGAEARKDFLHRRKIAHLIITQGSKPTTHVSAEGVKTIATFPVEPCDTVGAGDTFAGVLASRLAEEVKWERAIWEANVAAALSTLALGAQEGMPTRAALESALQDPGADSLVG